MTTVDAPPILAIRVYGQPAPQGSKDPLRNQASGRIQMVESSKRVKPWRADVKQAALDAGAADRPPYDGPVRVDMTFAFVRPKSHYRTGRNAHLLRDGAPKYPHGKPDLSKLVRSTEDALTGVVWTDDSRVVGLRVWKLWTADRPGALITVWPATPPPGQEGLTA